jgi:hypothetical protein
VEFTRAVGDDSSKYHRPHRQADHGLHYGRFQTERFCGSGSRGSCQSRSSPDSPEGAGSTHQQVRSSGDTPFSSRPWLPQLVKFTDRLTFHVFYHLSFFIAFLFISYSLTNTFIFYFVTVSLAVVYNPF